MLGFVIWPYIHARWSVARRFESLGEHHAALSLDMQKLKISAANSIVVADLDHVSKGLRLVVDRAPWCLREGSLVFSQFVDDERLMSLAFSFDALAGERVVYVGGLQGSNAESALNMYRELARPLQGMRSRDFVVKTFQLFTHHLGIGRVLCVGDDVRHHRHPYFGKSKLEDLHLKYDQIWTENAGTPWGDGLFLLPSVPIRRPMSDIAAKNRALYRRRYELMDNIDAEIGSRLASMSSSNDA
jgi:uncharacterized protein VirK/YbjX